MDLMLVFFAFSAGLVAFLNPCGFVLLPSYISYYLGLEEHSHGHRISVFRGIKLGLSVTTGFIITFAVTGFVIMYVGRGLARYIPYLSVMVGVALVILGIMVLFKSDILHRKIGIPIHIPPSRGFLSFFIFGIAYAVASLSCTLPIFLAVVLQAVSTGSLPGGVLIFLSYSVGMGTAMLGVSISLAASKNLIIRRYKRISSHFRTLSALVLITAGCYIIYFQLSSNLLSTG
jgi:cytochrome c biogenesis protein CcdA